LSIIPTGCPPLDRLLGGGFPSGHISLVYGEAETGKTTLAIQCAVNAARAGYKTIFIDSDGAFSPERLSQIAYHDLDEVSPLIILVRPASFQEQAVLIDHLDEYLTRRVGLVVVDTITSLYRAELGRPEETFTANKELNRQVASLAQTAKTHEVAVLLLSQVHGVFTPEQPEIEPLAARILKFWSDIVLRLAPTGRAGVIQASLKKHLSRRRPETCYFVIRENGLHSYDIATT